jgi:hypothetical protein
VQNSRNAHWHYWVAFATFLPAVLLGAWQMLMRSPLPAPLGRLSGAERLQLLGDFPLGSVKCSKEDATAAFEIVGHDGTTLELEVQRRFDQFGRHFEQLLADARFAVDSPLEQSGFEL